MKNTFALMTAAAVLWTGTAFAQTSDMYVTKSDDGKWTIHGGTTGAEGSEILQGEAGAAPTNCPQGSYWLDGQQMLNTCGTGELLGFGEITEGQTTASGEAFPENSYLVQPDGKPMSEFAQ